MPDRTITRMHSICAGHRVVGQGGHCENLHGHEYVFHLTCTAPELDSVGRIIDFGDVKILLCSWLENTWDHRFLVWDKDPWRDALTAIDPTVWQCPFNPTVENLAEYMITVVGPQQLQGTGVVLTGCIIEETRKCSASYSL